MEKIDIRPWQQKAAAAEEEKERKLERVLCPKYYLIEYDIIPEKLINFTTTRLCY